MTKNLIEFTFRSNCLHVLDFLYEIKSTLTCLSEAPLMFFYDHEMWWDYLIHYVLTFMHIKQPHNGKNLIEITFNTNCLFIQYKI